MSHGTNSGSATNGGLLRSPNSSRAHKGFPAIYRPILLGLLLARMVLRRGISETSRCPIDQVIVQFVPWFNSKNKLQMLEAFCRILTINCLAAADANGDCRYLAWSAFLSRKPPAASKCCDLKKADKQLYAT